MLEPDQVAAMERERQASSSSMRHPHEPEPSFDPSAAHAQSQGYASGMPAAYPSTTCDCADCAAPWSLEQPVEQHVYETPYPTPYDPSQAGMSYQFEPSTSAPQPAFEYRSHLESYDAAPAPAHFVYAPPPPPLPSPPEEEAQYAHFARPRPAPSPWSQPFAVPSSSSFVPAPPGPSRPPPYKPYTPYRYDEPAASMPTYQQAPSTSLQPEAPVLDRRRSSGQSSGVSATATASRSRRPSNQSTGSPRGSEGSGGSDAGLDERTTTPFMTKLHFLVNNPELSEWIRWSADGRSFVFAQGSKALSEAFARVFRHGNAHSFVRQLNIYDFKRLSSLELHTAVESVPHPTSRLTSADFSGFSHPLFYRDSAGDVCDLSKLRPKMGKKSSSKSLASSSGGSRARTLRSDGKVGGGMTGRKVIIPRASKTASRKRAAQSTPSDDNDASFAPGDDEPEVVKPKPKKARTAAARVRGRRGAMSAFTNIPLDLLYDICANLEPRDLLALSTTSKVFRSVVTGAASAPLWLAARERVGLPELEHPMTDLQYAHLLFGKGCAFCTRKNAGKPEVYYRARICSACTKDKFADEYTAAGATALDKAFKGAKKMHPFTLLVANCTAPDARTRVSKYHLDEVVRVSTDLHRRFPDSIVEPEDGMGADFFLFVKSRTSGRPRSQVHITGITEQSTSFERWWFAEREQSHWLKQEDAIKLRQIVRRFEEQGFVSEEFDRNFYRHSYTTKPELLTERTWTTVEAVLKPILLASRSSRRRHYFQDQISTHRAKTDANVLAAYWPGSRVDLSSLPVWGGACAVDGFVELDELWASHGNGIIGELDDLVRGRIGAMLRALADAHAEALSVQEHDDADELLPAARPSTVNVPPLPSFIPRSADEPVVATDKELVDFLAEHPVSLFVTSCCEEVRNGEAALRHATTCNCISYDRVDVATWALCGQGGRRDLKVDATMLLRVLYLKDLLDSTDLVTPDAEIENAVMTHKLDAIYPHPDRLRKVFKCSCGMYSPSSFGHEPLSDLYRHVVDPGSILLDHTVTVWVEYTRELLHALYRAEVAAGVPHPLGQLDYMSGLGDWMFDDDMYSDDDDSEMGYPGRRDDCCVM
ncbi:hypothetical protein JCM8208_000160 [Rhodotorula glutinis]